MLTVTGTLIIHPRRHNLQ